MQSLGICYIIWILNMYCCLRAAASADICRKILAGLRKKTDRWIRNVKITNHITARMHCAGAVTYQSQQNPKAAVFLLTLCRALGRNRTCGDSYTEFKPLELFSIRYGGCKVIRLHSTQMLTKARKRKSRENECCFLSRGSLFIVQTATALTDSHLLSSLEYLCNTTWNAAKAKGRLGKTNRGEDKWLT